MGSGWDSILASLFEQEGPIDIDSLAKALEHSGVELAMIDPDTLVEALTASGIDLSDMDPETLFNALSPSFAETSSLTENFSDPDHGSNVHEVSFTGHNPLIAVAEAQPMPNQSAMLNKLLSAARECGAEGLAEKIRAFLGHTGEMQDRSIRLQSLLAEAEKIFGKPRLFSLIGTITFRGTSGTNQ